MLHIVQRWHVILNFDDGGYPTIHELWIDDDHVSSVLQKLASLGFSANGLRQPASIEIRKHPK